MTPVRFNSLFSRKMSEVELIYNAASLADGGLNGHMAGLSACVEHGRRLEREDKTGRILDELIKSI